MADTIQEIAQKVDQDTMVLYKTSSIFPFEIFPTDVVVYLTKVDIVDRVFWGAQEIKTVMVPDIFTLEVQTTPFFSSISITNRQPMTPVISVKFLKNQDALELRAVIQGLVAAHYQKINLDALPPAELIKQVKELGEAALPAS